MNGDDQGVENPDAAASAKAASSKFVPRKAGGYTKVPVPQTDTGRRDEYSQARERTTVKELGKIAP
jgi:hypothetical protein